jgi:choline monooxygenase
MLNVYPGNVSINIVVPVGVDRTRTIFEWYFDDATSSESIAKAIAFSEEVQLEDIRICEDVQRGLTSGAYTRGRFSVKREAAVHHFQQMVHRYVTTP